jgi:hypothetical protein
MDGKGTTRTALGILIDDGAFYTTREVANLLRVEEDTVRAWRYRGGGPRYSRPSGRVNARVFYKGRDLRLFLESNGAGSTTEETERAEARP